MDSNSANDNSHTEVKEYMKGMATIALRHLDRIDARTVTMLHHNGLFKSQKLPDYTGLTLAVLPDKDHPCRVKTPEGPLLSHKAERAKPGRLVVNVADLFFSPDVNVRNAAYEHFNKLTEKDFSIVTPRTKVVLEGQAEKLFSENPSEWRMAAIALYDMVKDDWLCNLAATRQCLAMNFLNGAGKFFTAVIRPAVSSVESIVGCMWAPTEQKEQIEQTILESLAEANTLQEALDHYYDKFGHLPLAGPLSITRVIDEWEKQKGKPEGLWKTIWDWAESKDTPLPRYHACVLFVNKPELLGNEEVEEFWEETTEIVNGRGNDENELKWNQAWRIRCKLARHFSQHLESRLPGTDSERIASQACWLAEQTALLFGTGPEGLRNILRETLDPEFEISNEVWHLARPLVRPSRLRYATTRTQSVWSLSLLRQIGSNLENLYPSRMTKDQQQRIETAIFGSLLSLFPLKREEPKIYAFDMTVFQTAWNWSDCWKKNKPGENLEIFFEALAKIGDEGELATMLEKLPSMTGHPQELVACAFRSAAHMDQASSGLLWKLMSDQKWRDNLLLMGRQIIVETIFDGLAEVQVRNNKEWAYHMPHMFALACEQSVKERDRKGLLFVLALHSSMISDSVSAVERLVRSSNRAEFNEDISYWKKRLEEVRPYCPNWVKGRIRAMLACLNAV